MDKQMASIFCMTIFFGILCAPLASAAISITIDAPAQEWEKNYGTISYDVGYSVRQTSDLGYVTVGVSGNNTRNRIYVVKTDSTGKKEWDTIVTGDPAVGYDVRQTSDGGFIIAGKTELSKMSCLVKLNSDGSEAWNRTYNTGDATSVIQNEDGGYIFVGATSGQAYVVKTDGNGAGIWERVYGEKGYTFATGINRSIGGGYYFSGALTNGGLYIARIDSDGNVIWTGNYKGIFVCPPYVYYCSYSAEQTAEGGFIVTARAYDPSYPDPSERLMKISADGNIEWQKTYRDNGPGYGRSVTQTADGGYVATGFANITDNRVPGFYNDVPRIYLLKVNSRGGLLWEGQIGNGRGLSMVPTKDNGFIIVGDTYTINNGVQLYLIKVKDVDVAPLSSFYYSPRASILNGPMSDMSLIFEDGSPVRIIDGNATATPLIVQSSPTLPIAEGNKAEEFVHFPPSIPTPQLMPTMTPKK